jgi:hypothetical protein
MFEAILMTLHIFLVKCDELGMSSDDHPFPYDMPPFYPFSSYMPTQRVGDDKNGHSNPSQGASHHQIHNKDGQVKPFPFIKEMHSESDEDARKTNKPVAPISKTYFDSSPFQFQHRRSAGHRKPRSVMSLPSPDSIHGGERATIMPSIESHLTSFGFDSGRGCMLRAICEVHELPLARMGYGLIGEMITLFFR